MAGNPLKRRLGRLAGFFGIPGRARVRLEGGESKGVTYVTKPPYRSPIAVSEAVADLIRGKVVCELGCAEGDNLLFMSRYAQSVIGVELDPQRYAIARGRGIPVIVGNYREMELPKADVYYFWPNDGEQDNEFLVARILSDPDFEGTIIVGGDTGWPREVPSVKRCAKLGRLVEVPFNEGDGDRQSGIFLLAIIDAKALKRTSSTLKNEPLDDPGMNLIGKQTSNYLLSGARRELTSCRDESKNALDGIFQQTVSASPVAPQVAVA